METDWAENRANLPQTGLRKLIGKALDSVYDTGMRDMFRTRVEKPAMAQRFISAIVVWRSTLLPIKIPPRGSHVQPILSWKPKCCAV